jgi:hypothetical protein
MAHFTCLGSGTPNCLILGNANGDPNIDILDFGVLVGQYLSTSDQDQECGMDCAASAGRDADFNGDGVVDGLDYMFITRNFLASDKRRCEECCDAQGGVADRPEPITDISVAELELMGMGDLAVADLNGDGRVNVADMTAFGQGLRPAIQPAARKGLTTRTERTAR